VESIDIAQFSYLVDLSAELGICGLMERVEIERRDHSVSGDLLCCRIVSVCIIVQTKAG
jgi:hypothetical protein